MTKVESYGIIHQEQPNSDLEFNIEKFHRKGYVKISSEYKQNELTKISEAFNKAKALYLKKYDLADSNLNSIRGLFALDKIFFAIAKNKSLLKFLNKVFDGKFIVNQQNGLINNPKKIYEQGKWHRDLPYQHFISSKVLAINAIFCIDAFNDQNGTTKVLPCSQLFEKFPSKNYTLDNEVTIKAKAGEFIVLNAMTYHSGGFNGSKFSRRGINTVYSIPYIRHQIDLDYLQFKYNLSKKDKEFLGFNYSSIKDIKKLF